jgi:hypothetical protein
MKKVIPVLGVLIMLLSSCVKNVKEPVNANAQPSLNSDVFSSATTAPTKFGALETGNYTLDEKENIYKKLGVKYIRYTIVMDHWTGTDNGFARFSSDGFHIILNVNEHDQPTKSDKPVPFTKDTVSYKKKLSAILDKYKPEVLVIENEETNLTYHYGSMKDYLNMLRAATTVAHARGIKIADGGIHPRGICYFVWQQYMDEGLTAKANAWMTSTMNSQMQYAAKHPERTDNQIRIYWNRLDTLLNAFTNMKIDYVNMHIYEAINDVGTGKVTIPGCIPTMADYVRQRTDKLVLSNECGQHNTYATCVTSMLQAFVDGDYKYAIWFSGDGNNAVALTNSDGTLRPTGVAFQSFMATY